METAQVLIAAGIEDFVFLLRSAFQMNGFSGTVNFVTSGHALFRLIDAQIFAGRLPGVMVLDLHLAGNNDLLVLKELREDRRLDTVIIIYPGLRLAVGAGMVITLRLILVNTLWPGPPRLAKRRNKNITRNKNSFRTVLHLCRA